jgi:hypothetical protein
LSFKDFVREINQESDDEEDDDEVEDALEEEDEENLDDVDWQPSRKAARIGKEVRTVGRSSIED